MNSTPLYLWIIAELNKKFQVNNLRLADVFLSMKIEYDHSHHLLWISQQEHITDLL